MDEAEGIFAPDGQFLVDDADKKEEFECIAVDADDIDEADDTDIAGDADGLGDGKAVGVRDGKEFSLVSALLSSLFLLAKW